jgi:hypothetical protein
MSEEQQQNNPNLIQLLLNEFRLFRMEVKSDLIVVQEDITDLATRLIEVEKRPTPPVQPPKSSEDSKKNTEIPPSGIQPVVPQPLAGMTNEETLHNISLYLQNLSQFPPKAPTNRRATIEGSIRKNQEEANSNEDRVLRIVQIDDSDLPRLKGLKHPNQLLRFFNEVNVKLIERKADFKVGTLLDEQVANALMQDNMDISKREDILTMETKELMQKLTKLIRPKTLGDSIQWLKDVVFPKTPSLELSKTSLVYLDNMAIGYVKYRNDFLDIMRICSENTKGCLPSLHLREKGLFNIFLNGIPHNYGWTMYEHAQEKYKRDSGNPQAKLENQSPEKVFDAILKVMKADREEIAGAQGAVERLSLGRPSTEEVTPVSKQKHEQYRQARAKYFNQGDQRIHTMNAELDDTDLSPIQHDEDAEDFQMSGYEQIFEGDYVAASLYEENEEAYHTPVQESNLNAVRPVFQRSSQPQNATKPTFTPGEKRDYDRNQHTPVGNTKRVHTPNFLRKDLSSYPCYVMLCNPEGFCPKLKDGRSCPFSHERTVLDAALAKANRREWEKHAK